MSATPKIPPPPKKPAKPTRPPNKPPKRLGLADQLAAVAGLISLVIEFATALPLPSTWLGKAAKGLLLAYLGHAAHQVERIAHHSGIKLPARPSIHGPEGRGEPGLATSREEVRPAPGYDVALGSATAGSGRAGDRPDAGARAGDGSSPVPGAPRLVPVPAIPGQLDPRHWLANVGIGPQYDSLPGLATGTADYRRLP